MENFSDNVKKVEEKVVRLEKCLDERGSEDVKLELQ